MRGPSECQGVLAFVGLSWYDVYLWILGLGVMFLCLMFLCSDVFLMSVSCVDDGTMGDYFTRRQILLHWHSWLHSREADRCQGKSVTPPLLTDVRLHRLNMSMFSDWNKWHILRHCHFAVRSVNDPRVPKNIQCGSQKWVGLQRNSWRRCRAYVMDRDDRWINGSPFVDLRPYQPPAGSAGSKPPPTSYNQMQVPGTSMAWIQGALFRRILVCDDLWPDLLMMYDVFPVLKIGWIGGPVIAPYTPAPGGPGVPRPPPFVPGGNLPGGHCKV